MQIEISTEQLQSDISSIQSQIETLTEVSAQVFSCLDNLNGMWQGAAHDAFVVQTQIDYEALAELIQTLNQIVDSMVFAKGRYEQCQSEISASIAAIDI